MVDKDIFLRVIKSNKWTKAEFEQAISYYHKASLEEKSLFNNKLQIISQRIFALYRNQDNLKLKAFLRKLGLSLQQLDLILEYYIEITPNINDVIYYFTKDITEEKWLEELFIKCTKLYWEKDKLTKLSQDLKISYPMLIKLIQYYINHYSKTKDIIYLEIDKYIETRYYFYLFVEQTLDSTANYAKVKKYYTRYASKEEKTIFDAKISQIIEEFSNSCGKDPLQEIAHKYIIPINELKQMAYLATKDKKPKLYYDPIMYRLSLMLINDLEFELIEQFINNNSINLNTYSKHYLKSFASYFCQNNPNVSIAEIENKLLQNYKHFLSILHYKREKQKKTLKLNNYDNEEINEAKVFITNLIYGENNVYGNIKKYGRAYFYKMIDIIRRHDHELFNLYYAITNRGNLIISQLFAKLLNYLKSNSDFNVLDYYLDIKLPPYLLIRKIDNLSSDDQKLILNFLTKSDFSIITKEELQSLGLSNKMIINYLIEHNIPLSPTTYLLAQTKLKNLTGSLEK